MSIEISAMIMLFISMVLSSYSGLKSYQYKKVDDRLSQLTDDITALKVQNATLQGRVIDLENSQIHGDDLKKLINEAVDMAFLKYENRILKEKVSTRKEAK